MGSLSICAWPYRRHYLSKNYFRKTIFTIDKKGVNSTIFSFQMENNHVPQNVVSFFSKFRRQFLNPHHMVWFSYWKSQTFGKSFKTFGSRIFFLRFLKSIWIFGCCIVYKLQSAPPPLQCCTCSVKEK